MYSPKSPQKENSTTMMENMHIMYDVKSMLDRFHRVGRHVFSFSALRSRRSCMAFSRLELRSGRKMRAPVMHEYMDSTAKAKPMRPYRPACTFPTSHLGSM
jgi:hypothetical protein